MTDQLNQAEPFQPAPTSPSSTEQPSELETSSASESTNQAKPETSPSTPVVRLAALAFEQSREAEAGVGTPTGIGAVYALSAALGEVIGAISADGDEAEENFRRALSVSLHRRNAVMATRRAPEA